ncbi:MULTISPECIES: hypothetical protein [unclassified Streptomyces]|uniref:hypothetical protein n=1 Tax=unclassified Streptomyces TaxID=2593676 RepID=UPI002251694F|nr:MULTISPECIES: hypothetical protein [unclassified Streptomyces]MCX5328754.1 hypothetical protein [Streptomyces sp. NBC_00140]MCX5358162.1 hypothetical protein [Streptomyces sp. NBC_00124]
MNSPIHRTSREGVGANGPEHRLDQLLAHHHTQLTSAVADALDTDTGSAALTPLNRDLFHGLKPLQLPAPVECPADNSTAQLTAPLPVARLEDALTRLRDIKLMVERTYAGTGCPADIRTRAQTVVTTLERLHAGLQARTLAYHQVCVLFRELREHSAHIGTSMLALRTQVPQHAVEEWLRAASSLQRSQTTVLRLFKNADDNVTTQG